MKRLAANLILILSVISSQTQELRSFYAQGKYGFKNTEGIIVVPPKYDYADTFLNGRARVSIREKHSVVDHLYGYIDYTGQEVIPVKYNAACNFSEGRARVALKSREFGVSGNQWGYIDTMGNVIIPLKYPDANDYREGLAPVKIGKAWGYIDWEGNQVIPAKYDLARSFSEGLALVGTNIGSARVGRTYQRFGNYGYIDKTGKEVIPLKYKDGGNFSEGLAPVLSNTDRPSWGFINMNGKLVIPFTFSNANSFKDGLAKIRKDGKEGYITRDGSLLLYDFISAFSQNGLARVRLEDKYGFIDRSGTPRIPIQYDQADDFGNNNIVKVQMNRKYGFINSDGATVIPFAYTDVEYDALNGLIKVKLDEKYGLLHSAGKEVLPVKYDRITGSPATRLNVKSNNRWGYIGEGGREILYDSTGQFSEGLAEVSLNNAVGLIDIHGAEVVPLQYKQIKRFFSEVFVQSDKGWQVFNTWKRMPEPTVYTALFNSIPSRIVLLGRENSLSYYGTNPQNMIREVGPPVTMPAADEVYDFVLASGLVHFTNRKSGKQGLKMADGKIFVHPYFSKVYASARTDTSVFNNPKSRPDQWLYELTTGNDSLPIIASVDPLTHTLTGYTLCKKCEGWGYTYSTSRYIVRGESQTYTTTPVQTLRSEKFNAKTGTWEKTYDLQTKEVTVKAADRVVEDSERITCTICNGKGRFNQSMKWNGSAYIFVK